MNETRIQSNYAAPISGDIIFVVSPNEKHAVKTYQKAFSKPQPDVVHVAVIVTPIDVLETNFGKHAFTLTPPEWKDARGEGEFYRIMRRTDLPLADKQDKMTEAGTYFLDEKYNISDVFTEKPHRLGFSICSGLAHKILLHAGLISSAEFPANRNILPGELLIGLQEMGWTEIQSNQYFDDRISELVPLSPIAVSEKGRQQRATMRSYEAVFDQIHEMASGANLTRRDLLKTECMMANRSVFDVLASEISTLYQQSVHLQSNAEPVARHWTEEHIADKEWLSRLHRNEKDVAKIIEATAQIVEEMIELAENNDLREPIEGIIKSARNGLDVDASAMQVVLELWTKAELEFALATGIMSWEVPSKEPEIEWLTFLTEPVEASTESTRIKQHLTASFDATWGMAKRLTILLTAAATASEALVGKKKVDVLKDTIKSNFDGIRQGYQ